ncbi:hypothetical protein ACFE04_020795 [Oxalis oulophora]
MSLYAAMKRAGEEIARAYNHIYGLSINGPWGMPGSLIGITEGHHFARYKAAEDATKKDLTSTAGEDVVLAMNSFIKRLLAVSDPTQMKDMSIESPFVLIEVEVTSISIVESWGREGKGIGLDLFD